jgi:hypothetical protein
LSVWRSENNLLANKRLSCKLCFKIRPAEPVFRN